METMDPATSVWSFDTNSTLHQEPAVWPTYDGSEYCNALEENLSDSDSSLDSPAYGLYFNPVGDLQGSEHMLVSSEPIAYDQAIEAQHQAPSTWAYGVDAHTAQVYSPNSTTTTEDSETVSADLEFVVGGQQEEEEDDSSDETSQAYDDDSLSEEDSYSTSTTSSPSNAASPMQTGSGRPVRTSARGEHIKQVQAMIRQVNSAVDPKATAAAKVAPVAKVKISKEPNTKKRARVEPDIRSVTLTRDQLLTMTSEELDDFTKRLKEDHTLTAHELREIKRQRRLIKNREYAQASRVKKKGVLTDLSHKFSELEDERLQLIARVNLLEEENASLRAKLQMPPSNRPPLPFMAAHGHNASNNGSADPFQPPKAKRPRGRSSLNATTVGGGATLFALVLLAATFFSGYSSFGGFNNPFAASQVPPAPASTVNHVAHQSFGSQDYSTFRMMDIRSVTESTNSDPSTTDSPPELDPTDTLRSTISLDGSATLSNTILTMDELMADEHVVFASNNGSLEIPVPPSQPEAIQAY